MMASDGAGEDERSIQILSVPSPPVEPELATDAPEFRYWKRSLVDRITIYALMPCAFFLITIRWTVDPEFRSLAIPITFVHVVCVMSAAYLLRGVVTMFLEAVFAMSDDGRSLEQLLRFIPDDQRVIAMANFFRRFGASDQKLKETDRSLIVQGFQTNYMQVARAIAVASVGLMPHDRHVVMRMQELLDKASDDAEFDGFRALGQILGVDIKRRWMLPILGPMLQRRDGFTPDWTTLTEDQKKAIYCACAVSDRAHEAVVQLFDFADIPIEEEKAIVVAGLSDIPTGARNWPNRMVAYGILMTMTSKDRLWSLMAKVVGGNVYSASWVAMPSPIAHPEFELDRTQDRITIGGRMFLLSMLVSLTVLWAITPGRQVIVSNRVLQEFFQVTSYNAGFLTESLEHVLILSYVMAASILVITPITMFIFLVREVGLVKVSVEDRDIDPFGTIMNRKMITKLTTIGALAIITGLQAYFTVTADPSLLALLTDLSGLLQVVTAVSFPIAYACYANSPMIPHVVRAFDEGLYRRITPEGGALEKYELAVDERTMSVSMKVMDDDDDAISFSRVAPAPFTPMASAPPEPQPTLPIEPAPAPSAPFVPVPAPTPAMAPMMQPIAPTPPPADHLHLRDACSDPTATCATCTTHATRRDARSDPTPACTASATSATCTTHTTHGDARSDPTATCGTSATSVSSATCTTRCDARSDPTTTSATSATSSTSATCCDACTDPTATRLGPEVPTTATTTPTGVPSAPGLHSGPAAPTSTAAAHARSRTTRSCTTSTDSDRAPQRVALAPTELNLAR